VTDDILSLGGAFASFGFAFGVHPVLPSVHATMAKPHEYGRMIVFSFIGVMAFYLPMCAVGYGVYGEGVGTVIYDTPGIQGTPPMQAVVGLITLHLLCSYPLVLNPPELALEALWELEPASMSSTSSWTTLPLTESLRSQKPLLARLSTGLRAHPLVLRVVLRLGFVAFTTTVSLATPIDRFGPFLNLVSSFTSTFTVFILPCAFYVKLVGPRNLSRLELAWNVAILVFSVVGATFGTIGAAKDLFHGL